MERARWSAARASIAFYSIFALAPLLVVAIAVAGLAFGRDAVRGRVVEQLGGLLGDTAAKAIEALIASAWRPEQGAFAGVLGVTTLLIAATSQVLLVGVAFGRQFEPRIRAGPSAAAASGVDGQRSGST